MSSRVRLTASSMAAADQTPYPGNVNQPGRKDPSWEQYHTFEQKVNHELPDMRHQWQDDSRDDIGFGIPEAWGKQPTVASIRVAANKAIRVALLLLGNKVSEKVIEAQAQDLVAMGPNALDRTMQRFAETQNLYADDKKDEEVKVDEKKAADEVKVDEKKDEKAEEKKAATESEFKPKIEKPGSEEQPKVAADEKKDEVKVEDIKKDEEKKASDMRAMVVAAVSEALKAALPDFIQKKVDEKKEDKKDDAKESKKSADESVEKKDEKVEEKKAATDAEKKDEEKVEDKKAADEPVKKDEEKADENKAAATKVGANEFDIELTGAMDDEVAPDAEADERLASLFDNDGLAAVAAAGNSPRKVEASQKSGIKKLGFQPRVASATGGGTDISSIWQSAPDVSEAFR